MIDKQHGKFILTCDVCGEPADPLFVSFGDALEYARMHGWRLQWGKGIWENICPECREK